MSNKSRSTIRLVALIIIVLAVLMRLSIVVIPAIDHYDFWLVVIASVMVLVTSK